MEFPGRVQTKQAVNLIDGSRGQRIGGPLPSGNQARLVGSHPKCGYFSIQVSDTASLVAFYDDESDEEAICMIKPPRGVLMQANIECQGI